jgi:hypothetical protein
MVLWHVIPSNNNDANCSTFLQIWQHMEPRKNMLLPENKLDEQYNWSNQDAIPSKFRNLH